MIDIIKQDTNLTKYFRLLSGQIPLMFNRGSGVIFWHGKKRL